MTLEQQHWIRRAVITVVMKDVMVSNSSKTL